MKYGFFGWKAEIFLNRHVKFNVVFDIEKAFDSGIIKTCFLEMFRNFNYNLFSSSAESSRLLAEALRHFDKMPDGGPMDIASCSGIEH